MNSKILSNHSSKKDTSYTFYLLNPAIFIVLGMLIIFTLGFFSSDAPQTQKPAPPNQQSVTATFQPTIALSPTPVQNNILGQSIILTNNPTSTKTASPTLTPTQSPIPSVSSISTVTPIPILTTSTVLTASSDQVNSTQVLVIRVIDGDTIEIEGGQKVRYIGIDTPETVHPAKPVQCFGNEASNKNKELVQGKKVHLEKDVSETDKYTRLLRYVWVDGIFVNDYLIRQGYAYSSTYPPDVKYQGQFRQAQKEAMAENRGLWSQCKTVSNQITATPTLPVAQNGNCIIKGNISSQAKEKIYHLPGCASYKNTVVDQNKGERWFCSEEEARAAGWRKALNCP